MGDASAADTNPISFSIAVPVGRDDVRVASALQSLVVQDVEMQIALLDASGSPHVRDVAQAYDDALAIRIHRPDAGQSAAIREGWEKTSGSILCWLNADDVLLSGSLRKVARLFAESPETDVVYGHSLLIDSAGRTVGYHMAVDQISDEIFRTNIISQPSCFVRRRAIEDIGGIDTDLHYVMDWDLWIRLYRAGKVFKFVDDAFSSVVWEKGTKTGSISRGRLREILKLTQREAGLLGTIDTGLGVLTHHLGNYTPLTGFRKRLQLHHPMAQEKTIRGVDRDGGIQSMAAIPVMNASTSPRGFLDVELEGASESEVQIAVDGTVLSEPTRDSMRIALVEPVAPGDQCELTITASPGAALRFISAKLQSKQTSWAVSEAGSGKQLDLPGLVDMPTSGPFVQLDACSISMPKTGMVRTLKQTLLQREQPERSDRVLLQDIDLYAAPGERIGIVGRNGAGKSSLLRLIAGIYPPSNGNRVVFGEVAPVLALGRGLDPELTLRANVSLGLIQTNRNDLFSESFVDEVLAFAELSDRAHEPMRKLSSGLQARFAFSLFLHQAPDILILDEIFTVGDVGFVRKAQAEIRRRLDASTILFMASHDESEITEMCNRAILIGDGRIELDSDPDTVFAAYRDLDSEP